MIVSVEVEIVLGGNVVFAELGVVALIDIVGVKEGVEVKFVIGEGVDDVILAEVVMFGKPVENNIPLAVDVVRFTNPVDAELDVVFE